MWTNNDVHMLHLMGERIISRALSSKIFREAWSIYKERTTRVLGFKKGYYSRGNTLENRKNIFS
jgi:hypothetical protein